MAHANIYRIYTECTQKQFNAANLSIVIQIQSNLQVTSPTPPHLCLSTFGPDLIANQRAKSERSETLYVYTHYYILSLCMCVLPVQSTGKRHSLTPSEAHSPLSRSGPGSEIDRFQQRAQTGF